MAEKTKSREAARSISRRDFARRAALAAATAAVLPGNLLTQPEAAPAPAPQAAQPEQPKLSPEGRAEVEAKVEAIFRKYGKRLSEEQKADVRRLVTEAQKSLESLRAFPLDNADQPAAVFELYPEARAAARRRSTPRHPTR